MARRWMPALALTVLPACSDDACTTAGHDGGSTSAETHSATDATESGDSGDEPFGPGRTMPLDVDFDPLALSLADFNGDGHLDLLVSGTRAGLVQAATLLGDGTGGFSTAIDASVPACSAFPVTGHVDDDGTTDLFYGVCDDNGVFALGQPDGTFIATGVLAAGALPPVRSSQLVDFDRDGHDDLVALSVDDEIRLHVALSSGGTDPWPVTTAVFTTDGLSGFDPTGLGLAQLGSTPTDRVPDALLLDPGNAAAVALGTDEPGFEPLAAIDLAITPTAARPFDGGGEFDGLIFASLAESSLQLVERGGDGALAVHPVSALQDLAPFDLAWVDGRFAIVDDDTPAVVVVVDGGGGQFSPVSTHALPSPAVRVLAGDLNGDGAMDLVAATFAAGSVTVLLAN